MKLSKQIAYIQAMASMVDVHSFHQCSPAQRKRLNKVAMYFAEEVTKDLAAEALKELKPIRDALFFESEEEED